MKQSVYQIKKKEALERKALKLYRDGFTLREVGRAVEKSHEWVRKAVNSLTRLDKGSGLE